MKAILVILVGLLSNLYACKCRSDQKAEYEENLVVGEIVAVKKIEIPITLYVDDKSVETTKSKEYHIISVERVIESVAVIDSVIEVDMNLGTSCSVRKLESYKNKKIKFGFNVFDGRVTMSRCNHISVIEN